MSQIEITLFPKIAQQQSQDNISTIRDGLQVEQANSRPSLEVKSWLNLHRAAMKGDWGTIKRILDDKSGALTAEIDINGDNVLHVAARMGHTGVVKSLLERVSCVSLGYLKYYLETQVREGTVLHIAAIGGNLEMVKALVDEHDGLTQITNTWDHTPFALAAYHSNNEVVRYLYSKTYGDAPGRPLTAPSSGFPIVCLVSSGQYDVALRLLRRDPKMALAKDENGFQILWHLSKRPFDFLSGSDFSDWELWVYNVVPVDECNIPRSDEEDPQHQKLDNWARLLLFRKYTMQGSQEFDSTYPKELVR